MLIWIEKREYYASILFLKQESNLKSYIKWTEAQQLKLFFIICQWCRKARENCEV